MEKTTLDNVKNSFASGNSSEYAYNKLRDEAYTPDGCGQSLERVKSLLKVPHRYERDGNEFHEQMKVVRETINGIYEEDMPALRETGRPSTQDNVDISTLKQRTQGGTSRDYIIKRLKRDAPDIAERLALTPP